MQIVAPNVNLEASVEIEVDNFLDSLKSSKTKDMCACAARLDKKGWEGWNKYWYSSDFNNVNPGSNQANDKIDKYYSGLIKWDRQGITITTTITMIS